MSDQAHGLRNLIFRMTGNRKSSQEDPFQEDPFQEDRSQKRPPHWIVAVGAKRGVGTTTVAVNVAATLASQGQRVLLVGDDGHRDVRTSDVRTSGFGRSSRTPNPLMDVMQGHCAASNAIQAGEAGMMVLPGNWPAEPDEVLPTEGMTRLQDQLKSLQGPTELIVLDGGAGANATSIHFGPTADQLLVVTTCDGIAVMDAYATIKLLSRGNPHRTRLSLVTNQATDPESATDIYDRVAQSSLRFLGLPLDHAGSVPSCDSVVAGTRRPTVLETPTSPASQGLERLAHELTQKVGVCGVALPERPKCA